MGDTRLNDQQLALLREFATGHATATLPALDDQELAAVLCHCASMTARYAGLRSCTHMANLANVLAAACVDLVALDIGEQP